MEPKSKRIGGLPGLPETGEDARSAGPANENASTPAEQRTAAGHNIPLTEGPNQDPDTGAFKPARYPITSAVELKSGEIKTIELLREDR